MQSFYEVTENMDKTEGRGPTRGTGIAFRIKEDAIEFVLSKHYKKFACMGVNPGSNYAEFSVARRDVCVFQDMEDYEINGVLQERQKNLAKIVDKLTEDEYNLLHDHIEAQSRRSK